MKVKVLVDCIGVGYNLKAGEVAVLESQLAQKLINFQYVEIMEEEPPKKKKKGGE